MRFFSGRAGIVLSVAATAFSACASHPPVSESPRQVKVDANNAAEVQKAGYRIVNKNGQTLYCTKELQTGSHVQSTTTCLTQKEWDNLREDNRRALQMAPSTLPAPRN